jgi:hypothetical protein
MGGGRAPQTPLELTLSLILTNPNLLTITRARNAFVVVEIQEAEVLKDLVGSLMKTPRLSF